MSRILILFASHFGQTEKIAQRIASALGARGDEVELADAREAPPPPDDYDAVVLGSRVERGVHAPELAAYITRHRDTLRELPTAVFSVSMSAASPGAGVDPSGYLAKLFDQVAWRPARAIAFAGGLPYRKYGWFLRQVMRSISKRAGHTTDTSRDHELTDWSQVDAFAAAFGALVAERATSHAS